MGVKEIARVGEMSVIDAGGSYFIRGLACDFIGWSDKDGWDAFVALIRKADEVIQEGSS